MLAVQTTRARAETTERMEPRVLPWQQYRRCHFVSFVMHISGVKFEQHCSNISRDNLDSVSNRPFAAGVT